MRTRDSDLVAAFGDPDDRNSETPARSARHGATKLNRVRAENFLSAADEAVAISLDDAFSLATSRVRRVIIRQTLQELRSQPTGDPHDYRQYLDRLAIKARSNFWLKVAGEDKFALPKQVRADDALQIEDFVLFVAVQSKSSRDDLGGSVNGDAGTHTL